MFASIVQAMERREHLTKSGMTLILRQAFAMNGGSYRKRKLQDHLNVMESSETVRQASAKECRRRKIQSGLHGDMQRLQLQTVADPPSRVAEAEMSSPLGICEE